MPTVAPPNVTALQRQKTKARWEQSTTMATQSVGPLSFIVPLDAQSFCANCLGYPKLPPPILSLSLRRWSTIHQTKVATEPSAVENDAGHTRVASVAIAIEANKAKWGSKLSSARIDRQTHNDTSTTVRCNNPICLPSQTPGLPPRRRTACCNNNNEIGNNNTVRHGLTKNNLRITDPRFLYPRRNVETWAGNWNKTNKAVDLMKPSTPEPQ